MDNSKYFKDILKTIPEYKKNNIISIFNSK